uniref:Integrase catalytic domain-containing protein n=1 Tax=Nicotiana tabacum TaxID=4097 RepID=A0A1S4DD30_TOBAC
MQQAHHGRLPLGEWMLSVQSSLPRQTGTASYKAVTKKVVADFVRDRIVCRFEIPESIITDNGSNINSDLMKTMCETFKIRHKNSTAYRPQMYGAIEAANKNIKKILRKMIERRKQWHEKLSFALL